MLNVVNPHFPDATPTMEVIPLPRASYVNFEDAGIVLDLAQVNKMEIDGVEYKLRAYKI